MKKVLTLTVLLAASTAAQAEQPAVQRNVQRQSGVRLTTLVVAIFSQQQWLARPTLCFTRSNKSTVSQLKATMRKLGAKLAKLM